MKRFIAPLILISMLVLTGCEGALAPMGAPDEVPVDTAVLGTWVSEAGMGDEDRTMMTIWAFNETEYLIKYSELDDDDEGEGDHEDDGDHDEDDDDEEMSLLRVFSTRIDNVMFANIECLNCEEPGESDGPGEWFFFSWKLEGNRLLVRSVDDDLYSKGLKDVSDSAEIRKHIQRHHADPGFFDTEVGVFVRSN